MKQFIRSAEKLKRFIYPFKNKRNGKSSVSESQLRDDLTDYFNRLLENEERLKVVNTITQQINSTMDIDSLCNIIIEELLSVLDIDYCAIGAYQEEKDSFKIHYIDKPEYKDYNLYIKNLIEKCHLEKQTKNLNLNDINTIENFAGKMEPNYATIHLFANNKFMGGLFVHNPNGPVDENNRQILTLVANNIALAMNNAKLYSLLQQKDKDKLEFIASMSHEFKNPLNTIIGFTKLLKEGAIHHPEKAIKYLNNISTSSSHMSNLIVDIIDMAKAETNNLKLIYDEFSPKSIILEILTTQEATFENKRLSLKTSFEDILIEADIKRFRQIIYNLVMNAVKFIHTDGLIEIRTYCDENYFHFEIIDNGIGINEEDYDELFKFFSQASISDTKRREGHGIGLAVCKKAIDLHQGEISFKSRKGEGTTFWFKLPLKRPAGIEEKLKSQI